MNKSVLDNGNEMTNQIGCMLKLTLNGSIPLTHWFILHRHNLSYLPFFNTLIYTDTFIIWSFIKRIVNINLIVFCTSLSKQTPIVNRILLIQLLDNSFKRIQYISVKSCIKYEDTFQSVDFKLKVILIL